MLMLLHQQLHWVDQKVKFVRTFFLLLLTVFSFYLPFSISLSPPLPSLRFSSLFFFSSFLLSSSVLILPFLVFFPFHPFFVQFIRFTKLTTTERLPVWYVRTQPLQNWWPKTNMSMVDIGLRPKPMPTDANRPMITPWHYKCLNTWPILILG